MFPYPENTHNPNPIFKITIYCTQYIKNANTLSENWKVLKKTKKNKKTINQNIIHISSIINIL